MSGIGRRRALALLAGAPASLACKRQRAPKIEEVWDEVPSPESTEALAALSPPWPPPTVARLDSGLTTFWLHEPDNPAFHARVLLPTRDAEGQPLSAAATAVVGDYMRRALTRRAANRGGVVALEHGPDRLELVVHGSDDDAPALLSALARTLDPRLAARPLDNTRSRLEDRLADTQPHSIALGALVAQLLGRPRSTVRVGPSALASIDSDSLVAAWQAVTDPRRGVLVVHAGTNGEDARKPLRELSDRWHGLGRAEVEPSAVTRLRGPAPRTDGKGRLLAEPAAAIQVVGGADPGRAVLVLGRVVKTATAQARSLARLAQRLTQEELDARLTVAGPHALFVASVEVSSRDADGSVSEAVDVLSELATRRQPRQRLFQAAELWLGARVVQASLDGEDWTSLWAEAMDLADADSDIAGALAADARAMLEPDAEALLAWQREWLDPRGGAPGWSWAVAGAEDRHLRRLARIAPLSHDRA